MTQLTRKAANAKVIQLEAQLQAAGGETRKNLRNRLARTSEQVKTAKELLKKTIPVLDTAGSSVKDDVQKFLDSTNPADTPPPASN
jgi:hypothetical protein